MGGSQTFQGAWSLSCTSLQAHAWELVFALLVRKTLGGMYFEMHSTDMNCHHWFYQRTIVKSIGFPFPIT